MKIYPLNNFTSNHYPKLSSYNQDKKLGIADNSGVTQVPASAVRAKFMPTFSSLARRDSKNNIPLHSGFYRDFPTLIAAAGIINKTFPEGTMILDGACSSGEELISLYSLLQNSHRYKFVGFDKSDDALKLAGKNIYSVLENYRDDFLIKNQDDSLLVNLQKLFGRVMETAPEPDFELNEKNSLFEVDREIKYFKMKDEHRKNIDFVKLDITDVDNFLPEEEAGAIFFRNALYLLTGNYLSHGIMDRRDGHNVYIDKTACLNNIVDKVYDRLPAGGIFVVGEIPAEHVYLADKYTPKKDKIIIDKVPMFDYDIDYCMADPETEIYKKSPLHQALKKDKRFLPVFYTTTLWNRYTFDVPTIWKKVK